MCQIPGCCVGKPKLVCFTCRLTGKGAWRGWGDPRGDYNKSSVCPRCRQPMENVGMGAKIPAKTNARRWRSLEAWHRKHHPLPVAPDKKRDGPAAPPDKTGGSQ